jgi:hypothetical protein
MNFVAGLGCWLGFSIHWDHVLARSSHQELEIPMQWSELDQI